ncbi:MAG TPA: hypothetical protein VND91_08755 [Candidatus Saccharimonadia bacterium]|nr:hypothetical protein [Candidatus Saccharimonadia bacterium]
MSAQASLEQALAALDAGPRAAAVERIARLVGEAVLSGRADFAASALERALAIAPAEPALLSRYAAVSKLGGDDAAALRFALAALDLSPGDAIAAALAVEMLTDRIELTRAVSLGEACIERDPRAGHVMRALAQAYLFQGRAHDAQKIALRAAALVPGNPAAVGAACLSSLYDDTLSASEVAERHRRLGAQLVPLPAPPFAAHRRDPSAPIRVGFVSGDIREHPVGLFVAPLLAAFDRGRIAPFVYARGAGGDALTARVRALPLAWRDTTALDDASVLARIRADRIDVLVDLSGHTHGGRPRLVASRAAPFQASWLGYPHATGIPQTDALFADARTVPRDDDAVLRLPAYLPLPASYHAPDVAPPPSRGGAAFTFGSFNHLAKLSDRTVALWCEVLRAAPQSRLALCALGLADAGTRERTHRRFAARGVGPERLLMLPPRGSGAELMEYYGQVDLALDPLPFNGGTTTLQALGQGVPTLTLPGATLASRMGLSVLGALGLDDELVATDAAHYVALAAGWMQRGERLAELRGGLRGRLLASDALHPARFAAAFAALLDGALERA